MAAAALWVTTTTSSSIAWACLRSASGWTWNPSAAAISAVRAAPARPVGPARGLADRRLAGKLPGIAVQHRATGRRMDAHRFGDQRLHPAGQLALSPAHHRDDLLADARRWPLPRPVIQPHVADVAGRG